MADHAIDMDRYYTYKDYLSWPDDFRCELIDGKIYDMCAAPMRFHQEVLWELTQIFGAFFKTKHCRSYIAPFDVILPAFGDKASESDTVVQPDLSVFCDLSRLTEAGATGAPDLVVEILSPSTAFKDQEQKRVLYERHRVREYWVVNPANFSAIMYVLGDDGAFRRPQFVCGGDSICSSIFPGLEAAIDAIMPPAGSGELVDQER